MWFAPILSQYAILLKKTLFRGATIVNAKGSFTGDNKYIILTVLSPSQAVKLRNFIKENSPGAFLLFQIQAKSLERDSIQYRFIKKSSLLNCKFQFNLHLEGSFFIFLIYLFFQNIFFPTSYLLFLRMFALFLRVGSKIFFLILKFSGVISSNSSVSMNSNACSRLNTFFGTNLKASSELEVLVFERCFVLQTFTSMSFQHDLSDQQSYLNILFRQVQ